MANVTFSSPVMARDVTVYAVAGDRGTILAIAKANKIPIPFDCQDGECGSCLIEVKHLDPHARYAIALTEKEKEMLKQLGKITKAEIADAEVNDMPPRHRLACQCFVRNEDIVVSFEGDQTMPTAAPHVTHAARRFKGGTEIATVEDLLGYAAKVEDDAAAHLDDLAKATEASGNADVGCALPPACRPVTASGGRGDSQGGADQRRQGGSRRLRLADARDARQHGPVGRRCIAVTHGRPEGGAAGRK